MDFGFILASAATELFSPTTAAYALAALGLAVHFGYSGLLNFGQAGFMAVGAYGFAISTLTFGVPFFVGLLIAVVCSVLFALVLGIPTLRLRADYLAIVTIAAAEIVRYIVTTNQLTSVTGSANGLAAFEGGFYSMNPFPEGSYFGMNSRDFFIRVVGWALVALCCTLVWLLMRSPWGRVLKGIREDEDAVRSLGKNVYAYKMQSLVLGGVIGAVAGIVYVLPRAVQPDSMGRPMTFFVWTILLLGGAATVFGPVLGSMIFWAALMLIKSVMRSTVPPEVMRTEQIEQFGWIVVGVTLMLLVIFRPQGVLGDKKELAINVR